MMWYEVEIRFGAEFGRGVWPGYPVEAQLRRRCYTRGRKCGKMAVFGGTGSLNTHVKPRGFFITLPASCQRRTSLCRCGVAGGKMRVNVTPGD